MTEYIRYLIRRDLSQVLEIDNACFEFVWTKEDFIDCLRQKNCIGMVIEHEHKIIGFMIYEFNKHFLKLLDFAVRPSHQRRGFGTQMIDCLKDKIGQQRRNRNEICCEIRESNLPAQLFFRAQGFTAVDVLKNHYDDTDEDAYLLSFLNLVEAEA